MSDTDSTPQPKAGPSRTNIVMALVIIVAIVGATWWMGERNGWADIGTGGTNARLLPKIGDEAPEFFTLSETGEPMELSQFRGQPVWLNFWGSWCAPCRAEMPEFISAYETLTEEGIVVLAVSVGETPEQSIRYRNLVGGTFPVYIDPTYISLFIDAEAHPQRAAQYESMRNDWQIFNYPTHVFIGADGIVQNVVLAQLTEEEMLAAARSLMEPQPTTSIPDAIVHRYE